MRRIVGIAAALAAVVFLAVPSAAAAERGVVRGTVLESALTRTDEGGTFIEVHVRGEGIWTASVWVSSENAEIFVQAARLRGDWVGQGSRPTLDSRDQRDREGPPSRQGR